MGKLNNGRVANFYNRLQFASINCFRDDLDCIMRDILPLFCYINTIAAVLK